MHCIETFCDAANALRSRAHDVDVDAARNGRAVYAVRFDCADAERVAASLAGTGAYIVPDGSGCVVRWTAGSQIMSETAWLVACAAVREGCEIYPVED